MSSIEPPKLLVTTSVILEAVFGDDERSPARSLFKMAENGLAALWTGYDVVRHTELVFRKRSSNDEQWKNAAATTMRYLVQCHIGVASEPNGSLIESCGEFTPHESAAKIIATTIELDCEVLVVTNQTELLKNPKIGPPNTRFVVMSPRDAFDWALDQAAVRSRLRAADQRK